MVENNSGNNGNSAKPAWDEVHAQVTLRLLKRYKQSGKSVRLRPIIDVNNLHLCPLALLLIHSLCHGLMHDSTIQNVLRNAANAANRQIVWLSWSPDFKSFIELPRRPCHQSGSTRQHQSAPTYFEADVLGGQCSDAGVYP